MYATVADLRSEGIADKTASKSRLRRLLVEATARIDRITGQFFEPRSATVVMDGRGTSSLKPPWVPLQLEEMSVDGAPVHSDQVVVHGGPVLPGFEGPLLRLRQGVFPTGNDNVEVRGTWGYTQPSTKSVLGRVPADIRRACMLLVLRMLPELAEGPDTNDARNRWRLVEERTRDQSYKLSKTKEQAPLSGDPEIDRLLEPYLAPIALGVA